MSKTFKWTVPDFGLSPAEVEDHRNYKPAAKGIHVDVQKPLSKAELKFLEKWGQTRQSGKKAFYHKLILHSCLAVSIITGAFLLLKSTGLIDEGVTLYTTGTMIAIAVNVAPALNSWQKNEKR